VNTHPPTHTEPLTEDEVLAAAAHMVAVFGRNDTAAYFDCFDESATFLFYYEPDRLNSRADYERLWESWMREGIRVTSCRSLNQRVQIAGSCGLFLHDVESTFARDGEVDFRRERETIVFARVADGSVRCIHEHLSSTPDA
jgi:ketosteroid isomerase-like protein